MSKGVRSSAGLRRIARLQVSREGGDIIELNYYHGSADPKANIEFVFACLSRPNRAWRVRVLRSYDIT